MSAVPATSSRMPPVALTSQSPGVKVMLVMVSGALLDSVTGVPDAIVAVRI